MAVLWTSISIGMARGDLAVADDRPISYLGTDPRTTMLFRGGLLVATALLAVFAGAVARHLERPAGFLMAFLGGQACQAVVAVVSIEGHGTSHAVHTTAGIALGLSLPLLLWRFAAAQPPGPWRRLAHRLLGLEVAGCAAGVALSIAGLAVVAEVVPAALFHLWVIVVTLRWPAWPQTRPSLGSLP